MAMSAVSGPAPPVASLSMLTGSVGGGKGRLLSAGGIGRTPSAPLLRSSFLSSPSLPFLSSSLSGLSLGINLASSIERCRRGLVVRAGKKYQLCQTKRNRSRKSLARTHGFRRRMRTTSGRAVLRRRRAKGRKVLCTKTNPSSGKRS